MVMSILYEVAQSNQSWAAERAQMALQVHEAVQRGEMSADEAKAIYADLANTEQLEQAASDAQLKANLVFGITQLASLI
jgi:polyhydroxyalkanoate synthesis regulator phasin